MNLLVSMRYLVALDEHKHFARAAQACFVTQPALSNALKALEEEFGAPIVKRGRTFVGFTPEGVRLLESARRMLHEEQLLKQDLRSVGGQIQGRLAIGVVPSAEPVAARFAALLQARHPGIAPVVRSMSSQEIEEGLQDLALDLGLGFTERVKPGVNGAGAVQTLPQYVEHYFLVSKAVEEAGARPEPVAWKDAAVLPLALMTPEMHNRHIIDDAFAQVGLRVQPVLETSSLLTLALAVAHGEVCSIMPGALVDAFMGGARRELLARPLVGPEVSTPIGFMTQPGVQPSRVLQAALSLAQDAEWQRLLHALPGA